eukprot:scaffold54298_cov44-Phaeocystis_antarctica.AAC.2
MSRRAARANPSSGPSSDPAWNPASDAASNQAALARRRSSRRCSSWATPARSTTRLRSSSRVSSSGPTPPTAASLLRTCLASAARPISRYHTRGTYLCHRAATRSIVYKKKRETEQARARQRWYDRKGCLSVTVLSLS